MLANVVSLANDRSLTDEIVISHILAGKKEEFEILIRRYNNQLYKTAKGIISDEADIEDAMQEAYVRSFEKLHQFRNEARFSTWLTRILINCALRHIGKNKGKHALSIDTVHEKDLLSLSDYQEENQAQMQAVEENLGKAVEGAIMQLPAKYRTVFILREVEDKSVAETAEILSITQDNVKIRLHRAKTLLKRMLQSVAGSLQVFDFHAVRCAQMAERVMRQIASIRILALPV